MLSEVIHAWSSNAAMDPMEEILFFTALGMRLVVLCFPS